MNKITAVQTVTVMKSVDGLALSDLNSQIAADGCLLYSVIVEFLLLRVTVM